jgi:predicted Zn finger-like uncharacterized protein
MLIQCQSCNAKYRLNLERIPNKKSFIKCKKCNAPIYIDPQEDAPGDEGVITGESRQTAEAASTAGGGGVAMVTCPNCGARYNVPAEQLSRQGLKLKCTNCDSMFPVPEEMGAVEVPPAPLDETGPSAAAPDFFPSVSDSGEQAASDQEPQMPLPDDARASTMFDDLQVNLASGTSQPEQDPSSLDPPSTPPPGSGVSDPERDYLEAVSFSDDGTPPTLPGKGNVSDDKKYRFFMKPGVEGDDDMADGNEPEDEGLPPLDDSDQALAGEVETSAQGEAPIVPPQTDDGAPDSAASESASETVGDSPNLPVVREEPASEHPNSPIPDQEIPATKENFRYRMLWVAVLVVVVVSAGWAGWLWTLPGASKGYGLRASTPAEFTITNTERGYFVTNKSSGERLYVLTGEVLNSFEGSEQVGWIKLKGSVIGSGSTPQAGYSYIGNLLNKNQLATWALPAIRAYYGYLNGRDDQNYHIPQGKSVRYQIVLAGVRQPIKQITTELVSYQRRGVPVFVEQFQ